MQQACHGFWVTGDYGEIGAGRGVGELAALFPVAKGANGDAVSGGEGFLGEIKALAKFFDVGDAVQPEFGELLVGAERKRL